MRVDDADDLHVKLQALNLLENSPPFWWPGYGSFEVVIGAILTQNTSWANVEKSLLNLKENALVNLHDLNTCNIELLKECIRPSGFFNNKSKYIKQLTKNIVQEFGDFECFCSDVSREWLLEQKGVGNESADAILCYACKRAEMVVDKYTQRLLNALGYEFESYDELKSWCENLHVNSDEKELAKTYAEFHGMIVEYMKCYSLKSGVDVSLL
jgi:endonuclease-3 related protein